MNDTNVQPMTLASYQLAKQQQGAVLIIVLVVVLLVSIVAAITVRNSQTSADMSTAAQVKQLLMQSSDVPLAKLQTASIEQFCPNGACAPLAAGAPGFVSQLDMLILNGPLDRFSSNSADYKNAEYVLCYQPTVRDGLYSGNNNNHRILLNVGDPANGVANLQAGNNGYCNIAAGRGFYTSNRGVVATQVSLTLPNGNGTPADDVEIPPFRAVNFGTDGASVKGDKAKYVRSYVTSVMPSMAINSTVPNIDTCLTRPIGGTFDDTAGIAAVRNVPGQVTCLNATDVPMDIQVQDYLFYTE